MRNVVRFLGRGALAFLLALVLGTGAAQAQVEAYVANFDSNTVSVIDTATNTVIATVPAGVSPATPAFAPNGQR